MACARIANRYQILSSEADDGPMDDGQLPPSDPPDHSASDSDSDATTPIQQMPALTSLLGVHMDALDSSPATTKRVYRTARSSSVPPQESPIVVDMRSEHPVSDNIIFTPRKEKQILRERAEAQRQRSRVVNRTVKKSAVELERAKAELHAELAEEKKQIRQRKVFDNFLTEMKANNISLAEFLDHVFDPETKLNTNWRWRGFFAHQGIVEHIFGHWTTSKYNQTTRAFLHNWATSHVSSVAYTESRAITQSGILSKTKKVVNERFFLDFSLTDLVRNIRGMAPTVFKVFDSFSTTTRQLNKASQKFLEKKELMKGAAALTLLRGASQNNNYAQSVNGMYLAATGGQRQHFPVLGIYGFSIGYTSIISSTLGKTAKEETADPSLNPTDDLNDIDDVSPSTSPSAAPKKKKKRSKKKKPKRVRGPGLFGSLRDACMATSRALAQSRLIKIVYDNVNLMNHITEQILGRKSAQENGTCATLIPLHNTKLEHLQTVDLDESIINAPPLTLDDIVLDAADSKFFTKNMVHTILRVTILHGGEGFEKWRDNLDALQPVSADIIEVHKTPLHPLPAMEIDESSITGNVEVIEEIMRVLGFNTDDADYRKYVQIIGGDQLTIARQRSILNICLGHESGAHSWKHIVLMPGLFHAKIADAHGVLETHFGKPAAGARSPGSLGFHNTVLDRLPITLTSLPPFRTCRDLIMVSLYARVLHCLLLVSGHDSLEQCAASIGSWSTLVNHAEKIYSTYADVDRVQELREKRIPEERKRDAEAKAAKKGQETDKSAPPHIRKGDMVFENTVLFLRDALLTREFADAIKSRDSGHVVIRADEVCTRDAACLAQLDMRVDKRASNWLANPQGRHNAFVEIDLVQEHLNFWIKKIYKADGAGHSWDWLALVSPCVDILQQLATRMNVELGTQQGSKHATPDLAEDIAALMASLDKHDVYIEKEGHVLDDDEKPVPDVISVGMAALTHGTSTTPLAEFNQQFDILRERRRLTPVADLLGLINPSGIPRPATSDAPTPNTSTEADDEYADLPALEEPEDSGDELGNDEPVDEEDLFAESPTLTYFDEGDVDLDMDAVLEWYLDDDDDGEYSDDDSDVDSEA
ncbi:hypothetical protein B0H19DRAFT_1059083 [Mycena capillaripes]|nr:hypothetical protein B0H19DRAFT_1059083 [Mycena capillaripes]